MTIDTLLEFQSDLDSWGLSETAGNQYARRDLNPQHPA
jgi:hypothetical protein